MHMQLMHHLTHLFWMPNLLPAYRLQFCPPPSNHTPRGNPDGEQGV
uniref:Uncharacterized protein n=1 Tax=Anguilla anguilla TaxID=7936 RepID=A0A0E9PFJ7_ANGAN